MAVGDPSVASTPDAATAAPQTGGCPGDNRYSSNIAAVGRIFNASQNSPYGTAWIYSAQKLVTAGHVVLGLLGQSNCLVEFNVPPSDQNGNFQHSSAQDQYVINQYTYNSSATGEGDDWGVFSVFPNSNTRLLPVDAQQAFFHIAQNNYFLTIHLVGYGSASGTLNFTQQISPNGSNMGSSGTILKYFAASYAVCSGSPVIDDATGNVIGIHTDEDCVKYGYNTGTSMTNTNLWSYLTSETQGQLVSVDQQLSNGTRVGSFSRWSTTDQLFIPPLVPPHSFYFKQNTSEILHADSNVYSGQKYQWWTINRTSPQYDVKNHHVFAVGSTIPTSLLGQFLPTDGGAVLNVNVDGTLNPSGSVVGFLDPWFIDYSDPTYANARRNRGFDGVWYNRTSPFPPNLTTQYPEGLYRGVFLNQQIVSGQPYYSVQAPIAQTIGGYTSIFTGWTGTSATFQQVGSNPSGYDQKAVVFTASGATVTANYSRTTVSANVTLPDGTYNFMGTLTVNSGVTLTVNSGAYLNFPSGAGLVVNGTLVASGVTFSQSGSGGWTGITLNGNNSSLTGNCTISYATAPLTINSVNTATITSLTINNSNFSSTQAVNVNNSTPTITSLQINGQSGSWNGVRYQGGRGGILQESTIQYCGAGHGIVIQGGSSPTISGCTISHDHFCGIIVTGNSSAVPVITGNVLTNNGVPQNHGLYFSNTSTGLFTGNYISGNNYAGVYVNGGSYPSSGVTQQQPEGSNTITGNPYGIYCTDPGSNVAMGGYNGRYYYGACNSIYSNTNYDAYAAGGGSIYAQYDWWGRYPPNSSQFYIGSGSSINYGNALTSQSNCPAGGGSSAMQAASGTPNINLGSNSADTLLQAAAMASLNGDNQTSSLTYVKILKGTASTLQKEIALVRLCQNFLQSGDTSIISTLNIYSAGDGEVAQTAEEQRANIYAATKQISSAENLANDLIAKFSGTETEKRALILLASIRAFDSTAEQVSASALSQLKTKFGASLDSGLVAALTTASDIQNNGIAANQSAQQSMKEKVAMDTVIVTPDKFELQNYPNPFNPTTAIAYHLPRSGYVTLKVYDILGREVGTLVNGNQIAGAHVARFDGSRYASGVYSYRLTAPGVTQVKKMLLTK